MTADYPDAARADYLDVIAIPGTRSAARRPANHPAFSAPSLPGRSGDAHCRPDPHRHCWRGHWPPLRGPDCAPGSGTWTWPCYAGCCTCSAGSNCADPLDNPPGNRRGRPAGTRDDNRVYTHDSVRVPTSRPGTSRLGR